MKLIQGSSRIAFLIFFVSHIPITILLDGQGAFRSYYPQFLIDVISWYCDIFGDVLMKDNENDNDNFVWFSSMICCEILFQLPFFIVAVKMIMMTTHSSALASSASASSSFKKADDFYPEWFRMICIIYGSHVSTTLVPIISTFVMSQEMSIRQKYATITSKSILKYIYKQNPLSILSKIFNNSLTFLEPYYVGVVIFLFLLALCTTFECTPTANKQQ
jgi:hypothetical protein